MAVYIATTVGCAVSPTMDALLLLRVAQGFGAGAGPVVGRAVIRDLFEGPAMARVMSLIMAVFILAPIVAPTLGGHLPDLHRLARDLRLPCRLRHRHHGPGRLHAEGEPETTRSRSLARAPADRRLRRHLPQPGLALARTRRRPHLRHAHHLSRDLGRHLHGRVRPLARAVRPRLRRGGPILGSRQPLELAPGPPRPAGQHRAERPDRRCGRSQR